jgi:steroid delta-isomerase-like uncharacterized protein
MDEPREVVRRFLEDVWSRGDLDACDQLINADHVHHFGARDIRGPTGVKALVAGLRQTFPDLHIDVDDLIAEGEKVAVRMTLRGTDRGGFMGQAPTDNSVSYEAVDFFRVVNGKLIERWGVVDALTLRQQLAAGQV